MMERLFVYGTLTIPTVQQVVLGRKVTGTPDALLGFRKSEIRLGQHQYPIAVPEANSRLDGLMLELTLEELARADAYETDAYQRIRVTLASGAEAWMYALP